MDNRVRHSIIKDTDKMIFVFGSNEAGIHGAGAARYAEQFKGAKYRYGVGLVGQSYAIPTKDMRIITLPIEKIASYVDEFIKIAEQRQDLEFQVTRIGCGLAGYEDSDTAPLFQLAPCNCFFDTAWKDYLGPNAQFWGTI